MKNKQKELISKIVNISKELRLPGIRRYMVEDLKEASGKNLSYEEFLYNFLLNEYDLRIENSKKNRIRLANFPYKKYLEDLSIEDLLYDAKKRLKLFTSLDFVEKGQNVILAGSPATGKTHLAIALGIKACMAEYKVLFATIPLLINQLK